MNDTRKVNTATGEILEQEPYDESVQTIPPAQSTELIIRPPQDAAQFNQNSALTKDFVKASLVEDVDFGVIPGTDNQTLLQPGAEKLARFYNLGCFTKLLTSTENFEIGFFSYTYECIVRHLPTGIDICRIERNCNSYESKYLYENVFPNTASDEQKARKVGMFEKESKKGTKYKMMKCRKAPDELAGGINTYQGMAQKRAIVAGVRQATMATDLFRDELAEPATGQKTTKAEAPQRTAIISKLFVTAKGINPAWDSEHVRTHLHTRFKTDSLTKVSNADLDQMQVFIMSELSELYRKGAALNFAQDKVDASVQKRYGIPSLLLLTFEQIQECHQLIAQAKQKAEEKQEVVA